MTQELTPIENALPILAKGGDILKENQERFSRAKSAGESMLASMPNGIENAEQDAQAKVYIDKIKATVETLNTNRSEFTKVIDLIKSEFTGLESGLDVKKDGTPANKLQKQRNDYAAKIVAEQEARRKEVELQQKRENEKARLQSEFRTILSRVINEYTDRCIRGLVNSFNEITLANFDVKKANLLAYEPTLTAEKYNDMAYSAIGLISSFHYHKSEIETLLLISASDCFQKYLSAFSEVVLEKKFELVEMLPSKKQELERIAEFEKQQAAERAEAERLAQEAAKAQGAERAELERQQAEQAAKRKEAEQEEALRQQREDARLKAEADKLEADRVERERIERERIEMDRVAAVTNSMFAATTAVTQVQEAPKVKTALKASINHQAGAALIFQMWYERVGQFLPLDELTKKISFCFTEVNKAANKDGRTIDSPYVVYENEVKAK